MEHAKLVSILKTQVKPALGCTEPVAVALAASTAYREVAGDLDNIIVKLSPNIFKNGLRVGIPGTPKTGLVFATALAVVCGNPDFGLEVFKNVEDEDVIIADKIVEENKITVGVENQKGNFYIEVEVFTNNGTAKCVIKDTHTNIVLVEKNGETVFEKTGEEAVAAVNGTCVLKTLTIKDLRNFIEEVAFEEIDFLLEGVALNMAIAETGLKEKSGLGVGAGINDLVQKGIYSNDIVNKVRALTASACDARMSGINMPVMSSAGSGNHGITAIVPPTVVCRELGCDDEKLARALAFSHLVTAYIKEYTGKLSPVCGCGVAAGTGASVAIAWIMGATDQQIAGTIKNMVGSISGMVCDGAKGGCAFKLATAASEATIQAQLAVNDVIIGDLEGIVGNAEDITIKNLGKFCMEGMGDLDNKIIEIMLAQ
ncbi:L-cysteine desulfidase family protein [Natronincola ferrireducens]|uniref:UPF0597 protein SAMN05660472_02960 n=1 Tax=Natronincola ferrireducens TaxID=393762 RepID=A0A1G9IX78_9FIRM|nr:L-serine ammonia-lyase, iron-sulfur-dependent, subunit alpha [Natronincola ferrireducens]SDL29701.1 L-cysteine desulfidase [Natronincola ferrireducens]